MHSSICKRRAQHPSRMAQLSYLCFKTNLKTLNFKGKIITPTNQSQKISACGGQKNKNAFKNPHFFSIFSNFSPAALSLFLKRSKIMFYNVFVTKYHLYPLFPLIPSQILLKSQINYQTPPPPPRGGGGGGSRSLVNALVSKKFREIRRMV